MGPVGPTAWKAPKTSPPPWCWRLWPGWLRVSPSFSVRSRPQDQPPSEQGESVMSADELFPRGRVASLVLRPCHRLRPVQRFLARCPYSSATIWPTSPACLGRADFFITSDIHYLAAALLSGHGWPGAWPWTPAPRARPGPGARAPGGGDWTLLGLLVISGAVKVLRNMGIFLPPPLIMVLDFTHLGSAMAFMIHDGLVVLVKPKPKSNLRGLVG